MDDEKYVGLITVRTNSSRLPKKCLLSLGKETVLKHVIKRAKSSGITPIVCTTIDSSDDIIEQIASELNVDCYRGEIQNKLKRWADCARKFNLDYFHSIDADDPLFDGEEMKHSIDLLIDSDFDVITPSDTSASGGASVGYSLRTNIVNKALINVDVNTDTEMMWYYLEKIPGIKMKKLPENDAYVKNIRLTLDYEEDYWLIRTIFRILGENPDREKVNELFINNPNLAEINLFRNDEWKAAQLSKKI